MPHSRSHRIRAGTPWTSTESSILETGRDMAPAQDVPYECERCGTITRRYADDIEPPPVVDCRCGKPARLPCAPEDAKPVTPRYGPPEYRAKGRTPDDVTPWAQLLKRRTMADLERILAERLAEVKQTGVAR